MSALSNDPLASFYRVLWETNEAADPRFALFERSLGGRPLDEVLYELARQWGVGRDSVVLDVGCGKGRQACQIAKRLTCRVVATDPLEPCLRLAEERAKLE